ncbi:glycosyltransferase family 2 protein [Companilactobacillus metriopterae]|uniref:glycosyltransferase family 2 protein n=1 Tax=Companilactobacillus metriopterae TaxID=1909267 RepID=UPI00100B575E|nr:glycosyltransferase family 2 protein [Companilactobacillus metriopterae]
MKPLISIVLPVFNEEEGIQDTIDTLLNFTEQQEENFELIFVDDGSKDHSVEILSHAADYYENIKLVEFSRNFGHQNAITAGLDYISGDAVVVMDADLQDPPEVITSMVKKWKEGYDVVYGKRAQRDGESVFKKATASMFYRTFRKLSSIDMPLDTGDFRLMDKKVVYQLQQLKEYDPFVRGQVTWVGFKQTSVVYHRHERNAGETKYPLSKMLKLATDGIKSFSIKPLLFANIFAAIPFVGSIIYLITIIATSSYSAESFGIVVILLSISLMLVTLGIVGDYMGRILNQVNKRPRYIVRDLKGFQQNEKVYKLKNN